MTLRERVGRMVEYRKVLQILVRRDLRVRYARSWLGYVWTLVDPLMMSLIYAFVFGFIYQHAITEGPASRTDGLPMVMWIVPGFLPWSWFNGSLSESTRALKAERLLVRSTNIPREFWVVRMVLAKGVEHIMSLPIYALFVVIFLVKDEIVLNWRLVFIAPGMLIELILLIGMGLVLAPISVMAQDFQRIVKIVLRMMFYLTPVVYSTGYLSHRLPVAGFLQTLNPLTGIMDMYRVGVTGYTPNYQAWGLAIVISALWLVAGMIVFRKMEPTILKEI